VRLRPPSASRTGEELRNARIRCGYDVVGVARELGVPPGDLRALEWERVDLLGERYAAKLKRTYVEWLEPDGVPRPVKGSLEPQPARSDPG
jgi:hypothetical protein